MTAFSKGRYLCDGTAFPVLVWRFAMPTLAISSAPVGGGIGTRSWVVNAQVPRGYTRTDLSTHVGEIAAANSCAGNGVGMLTAASVDGVKSASEASVEAWATVGVRLVTWASDADDRAFEWTPGTINVVASLPVRCTEAALVNAVMTATEAKTQALFERQIPGTGTASDAVSIVCPASGAAEPFAGPRSTLGAALARVVHAAVAGGIREGAQ